MAAFANQHAGLIGALHGRNSINSLALDCAACISGAMGTVNARTGARTRARRRASRRYHHLVTGWGRCYGLNCIFECFEARLRAGPRPGPGAERTRRRRAAGTG
jgi:hypothetical protein